MDVNEILSILITCVIVPLLTWGVAKITSLADAKIAQVKSETAQKILIDAKDELSDAVLKAVTEVQATYVKALKDKAAFTTEKQKEAFELAAIRTREIMSDAAFIVLKNAAVDIESRIKSEIEYSLERLKSEVPNVQ